jgi:hypothetical protein
VRRYFLIDEYMILNNSSTKPTINNLGGRNHGGDNHAIEVHF